MPGFGKSGTLRMRVFSTSMSSSLSNLESREAPRRRLFLGVERGHARLRGAAAERDLDALDGVALPFQQHFDPAVVQVAHPAVHAFTPRGVVREPAEADALHPAADHVPARRDHGRHYMAPRSTEISTTPTGSSCATKSASPSSASSSRSTGRYGRSCSVNPACEISW